MDGDRAKAIVDLIGNIGTTILLIGGAVANAAWRRITA